MHKPQKYSFRQISQWLWHASRGARAQIALTTFLGILSVVFSLLFVFLSKQTIDIATGAVEGNLLVSAVCMALVMLGETGIRALDNWIVNTLGVTTQNRMRTQLFGRLMLSEWRGIERHHSGDVLNRLIQDLNSIVSLLISALPFALSTLIQLAASFFFLYSMDHVLAVVLVVIFPFFALLSRLYVRRMRRMTKEVRESDSRIHAVMQESLQHKTVVKTLEQDGEVIDKLNHLQSKLHSQISSRAKFSIATHALVSLGFSAGYLTAFLWGAVQLQQGAITFGIMTAFLQLVARIQHPMADLGRLIPSIVTALTSGERLMELEELPLEKQGTPRLMPHTAGVRIEDITFHYDDESSTIFHHFTADFPPNSTTAVLGETGAGKTTLIRLMLSLIHPSEGKISLYNDEEQAEASPETRCNFVYVPQGNTLFSGTIRDNLLLGRSDATEDELWDVLHMACADFVKDLPAGLDTPCGESGGGLSEGQAQRIAIARSLLRKGSILLLDEATSALDADTERRFLEQLHHGHHGKTIIFITHRTSVLDYCDRVLRIG